MKIERPLSYSKTGRTRSALLPSVSAIFGLGLLFAGLLFWTCPGGAVMKGRVSDLSASVGLLYQFPSTQTLRFGCSGVLIGPRHVLTAKHCVQTKLLDDSGPQEQWVATTPRNFKVYLGSGVRQVEHEDITSRLQHETVVEVTAIHRHPTAGVDLAILTLAEPVEATPARLPRHSNALEVLSQIHPRLVASGFGLSKEVIGDGVGPSKSIFGLKREYDAQIEVATLQFLKTLNGSFNVHNLSDDQTGTRGGDSGSGLFLKGKTRLTVIGILRGPRLPVDGVDSLRFEQSGGNYQRLTDEIKWIHSVLESN